MKKLTIDISNGCNLECRFCYQDSRGQLSGQEVLALADSYPDFGRVELGGGEPFLHKDICSMVEELAKKSRVVNIATNGTVVPDGFLHLDDAVREMVEVQVSMHASNAELYKSITGKDCFSKVMDNIEALKSRYKTMMATTVFRDNYHDVQSIISMADSLDIPLWINLAMPIGRGKGIELISKDDVRQLRNLILLERIKGKNVDSSIVHSGNCVLAEQFYGIRKEGPCPAETGEKIYISPSGQHYDCEFFRNKVVA